MDTTTKCPGSLGGEREHCYHQIGIEDTDHGLVAKSRCCRCPGTTARPLLAFVLDMVAR